MAANVAGPTRLEDVKKLWVRWVALTLLVIVLGLVMVRLGEWQLHRLSGRREANEIIRTNEN